MVSSEQRIIGQNMSVVDRMIATIRGGGRRKAGHLESPILLCEECLKKGLYVPSEVVDHIIPIAIHDFWDESNWQALCAKCNAAKGNRDKKIINGRQ